MKIGMVMSSYVYNPTRVALANDCFPSLLKTVCVGEPPLLIMIVKDSGYPYPIQALKERFVLEVHGNSHEGVEFRQSEQPAVHGTNLAFARGADYVTHLNDDSLFHPNWLVELEALIGRHPDAKAWSVYHSAYEAVHTPLETAGPDVRVRSLCGLGITFSREEWAGMGIDWRAHEWPSPRGSTLDLYHAHVRPGPRWCTSMSYMEHTGREGIHAHPGIPEYAQNFAGVGA